MTALAERHRVARKLRELDPDRPAGRKTSRKRAPVAVTPTQEAPELRLIFLLPRVIALSVTPGQQGYGVEVGPLNNVVVTMKTFDREKLFERAAEWLRRVAPKRMPPMSFAASLSSSSEGHRNPMKWYLAVIDGHVFATISPIGPLIFPAP